ncbi:MAG: hypothetical protein ACR2GN_09665 [Bacteroidia bacterium]
MKNLFAILSIVTLFSFVACDQNKEGAYDQRREDSVVGVRSDQMRMHLVDSMNTVCQSYMTYMQDSLRMASQASASGTRPTGTTRPTTTKPSQPTTQPAPTKQNNPFDKSGAN